MWMCASGVCPHGKNSACRSGVFPRVSCTVVLGKRQDATQCFMVRNGHSHLLVSEFKVLQGFGLALFFTSCGPFHAKKK